jgi:hypothetical protein
METAHPSLPALSRLQTETSGPKRSMSAMALVSSTMPISNVTFVYPNRSISIKVMTPRNRLFVVLALLVAVVVSPRNSFGQSRVPDECARTAQMEIYSDAQVSRVTGDLSGFDLALDKPNGPQRKALLFVYEGGGSEGIPLPVTANGDNLVIEGTWVEHLTEYPSKKDIVQTHGVRITGKITPTSFRGTISIEGLEIMNPDSMLLKRVKQIWACKTHSSR